MGGGNYLAKVSNNYTAADPNTIVTNGGTSNAHLVIENPTVDIEIQVDKDKISKNGKFVMDRAAISNPKVSYLFDDQSTTTRDGVKSYTSRERSESKTSMSSSSNVVNSTYRNSTISSLAKKSSIILNKQAQAKFKQRYGSLATAPREAYTDDAVKNIANK